MPESVLTPHIDRHVPPRLYAWAVETVASPKRIVKQTT